jgi:glycosyltransferase involved in cell wall biosynthesis
MSKNKLFFCSNPINGGVMKIFTSIVRNWPDNDDHITVGVNETNECFQYYNDLKTETIKIWPVLLKSKHDKNNVIEKLVLPRPIKIALKHFLDKMDHLWFLSDILYFRRQIKKKGFDVVVSHNGGYPGDELCLRLVMGAKMAGVKKIILVIHNYSKPRNNILSRFFGSLLDRIISHSCSSVISVSKNCADTLYKECSFNKKVDFIYNAIGPIRDTKTLKQKKETLKIKKHEKIIGIVGNLEKRKGHLYSILAMKEVIKKFPDSRLIIIGDDPEGFRNNLEKLIRENNLEKNVTITGYIDNAAQYFECFDIAVVPSVAYESFGMVILEAMYYKKPVIGTNIGGMPEVIKNGETGFVVPPQDVPELAEKIIYLLSQPEKAKQMGENGKKRLGSKFMVDKMVKQYFIMTN